ncbi:MAG TPA: glycosyltransferase family 4 protein, partial [Actinomycetota bacterium]
AFGDGGALDTVRDGKTGVLFAEQTPDAIMAAVARAESIDFDRELLAAHAARFGEDAFFERLTAVAREVIAG